MPTYQYKERAICKSCGADFTAMTDLEDDYIPIAYTDEPHFVSVDDENPQPCPACGAHEIDFSECRTLTM